MISIAAYAYQPIQPSLIAHASAIMGADLVLCESLGEFTSLLYRDPDRIGVFCMPGPASVIETIRRIRQADARNLVLALAGEGWSPAPMSLVKAAVAVLNAGADDCQHAGIDARELAARIEALARRDQSGEAPVSYDLGDGCVFFPLSGQIRSASGSVFLTRQQSKVLESIRRMNGSSVSRQGVLDHVYGERPMPEMKTVDVVLSNVRRLLRSAGGDPSRIENIYGYGYRFNGGAR